MDTAVLMSVAKQNPFKVFRMDLDGKHFLVLSGDKFVKPNTWKGKDTMVTNFVEESDLPHRLLDMQDDYKNGTETDGSKVDWTIRKPDVGE